VSSVLGRTWPTEESPADLMLCRDSGWISTRHKAGKLLNPAFRLAGQPSVEGWRPCESADRCSRSSWKYSAGTATPHGGYLDHTALAQCSSVESRACLSEGWWWNLEFR
jgi:hypothetical protein